MTTKIITDGADVGFFKTGPTTHALTLQLVVGGGGGAGGQIDISGQGGDAGDLLTVTVRVEPDTSYKWRRGRGGPGGNGIRGGRPGGDTTFYVNDLHLIARGGRGGRASGVFRDHPAKGATGSEGAIVIDELEAMPSEVEAEPKTGGIMLIETP